MSIEVPKHVGKEEERLLRQLAECEHKNVAPVRKSFLEKVKQYFSLEEAEEENPPS